MSDGTTVSLVRRERDAEGVLHDMWQDDNGVTYRFPTRDGVPDDWTVVR